MKLSNEILFFFFIEKNGGKKLESTVFLLGIIRIQTKPKLLFSVAEMRNKNSMEDCIIVPAGDCQSYSHFSE